MEAHGIVTFPAAPTLATSYREAHSGVSPVHPAQLPQLGLRLGALFPRVYNEHSAFMLVQRAFLCSIEPTTVRRQVLEMAS